MSADDDLPMENAETSDIDELIVLGQGLIDAILERKSSTHIQSLIDAGAPLWFQDDDGWSPLHAAANVEDDGLIRVLLQEGAVWNAGAANSLPVFMQGIDSCFQSIISATPQGTSPFR